MAGIVVAVVVVVFFIVLALVAAGKKPRQPEWRQVNEQVDAQAAAQHLSGAVRYQTMSYVDRSKIDFAEFDKFHAYLEQTYPLIHKTLKKETLEERSLMYFWQGSDNSLPPVAFLAHQDIVPVKEEEWSVPPFDGVIKDGYVYGRGTIDMKGQLIAAMESVELLLTEGFSPKRSIYLLFGADEENMGVYGAGKMSKLLEERGVRMHYVFDEGGSVKDGSVFGIKGDIAPIGICEKGVMNLKLIAEGEPGHASTPPPKTAVGDLARAIGAVEKHQMKSYFNEAAKGMFDVLTPYMTGKFKFLLANKWLFGGVIRKMLCKDPSLAAFVRTTLAPTQLKGSNAPNILATSAEGVLNIRVAPGQNEQDVCAHIDKVTGGIKHQTLHYGPPSPVSSITSDAYHEIYTAICDTFPEMVVAPYLVVAATDSRHYYNICDNVYRFAPFPSMKEDMKGMHGMDERISIDSLGRGVVFYKHLIRTTC